MEPTPSAPAEKITLPELLTVKETAEYLRVPQPTIYYLLQNGKLPGVMIGGRWRVKRLLIDRDILHSVPAEVASAETVSTQDAVGKQINIITAGGKNSTEGLDLLERLLKQSSTQVVSGDTDIEASNVIVLDARTFSERELTQEPLGARVAQNFPPEAHIVLVWSTEEIQTNLTQRRNPGTSVTLLAINEGDKPADVRAKVRKLVHEITKMPIAA